MKSVLPPKAVDTPDELAALSQFLVNVIDFRDPDCTMTHFRNPDVKVVLGTISGGTTPTYQPTYLAPIDATDPGAPTRRSPWTSTAWSTTRWPSTRPWPTRSRLAADQANRIASLSSWSTPCPSRRMGLLPANDFGAGITNPPDVSILDLSLANYDLVMTADDPVSRPDPFTGQLLPISIAKYYAQLPLNQANSAATNPLFIPALTVPASGDVQLTPLYSVGAPNNPPRGSRLPDQPDQLLLRDRQPAGLGHGDSSH